MKKTLFAALLLMGMSIMFSACDKMGSFGEYGFLVGCWVDEYYADENPEKVWEYTEFTKSGLYKEHYLSSGVPASFKDGVLSTPSFGQWMVDDDMVGKFDVTDGYLSVSGYWGGWGKVEKINKNLITIDGSKYYRINKRKEKKGKDIDIYNTLQGYWALVCVGDNFNLSSYNNDEYRSGEFGGHYYRFEKDYFTTWHLYGTLRNGTLYSDEEYEIGSRNYYIFDGILYDERMDANMNVINNDKIEVQGWYDADYSPSNGYSGKGTLVRITNIVRQ